MTDKSCENPNCTCEQCTCGPDCKCGQPATGCDNPNCTCEQCTCGADCSCGS